MLSRVLLLLLCSCAADRLASLPPFDHVADVSKVATVKADGSGVQWSTDHTGTATGDTACSGCVGEVLSLSKQQGGIALTTATACNIGSTTCPSTGGTQSITLTAGDWDVRGACGFLPNAATSITVFECIVSKTSATTPSANALANPSASNGEIWMTWRHPASTGWSYTTFAIPTFRVTVTGGATTSLYLVGSSTFTLNTNSVFGYLQARRVR